MRLVKKHKLILQDVRVLHIFGWSWCGYDWTSDGSRDFCSDDWNDSSISSSHFSVTGTQHCSKLNRGYIKFGFAYDLLVFVLNIDKVWRKVIQFWYSLWLVFGMVKYQKHSKLSTTTNSTLVTPNCTTTASAIPASLLLYITLTASTLKTLWQ